jgi:molybdopterin-guanine dinucleotide biosynthesis protein A
MSSMQSEVTGIVLAGGLSTRMGRDKASLPWDGGDLLHTILAAVATACPHLIVVSNTPRAIYLPEVTVVSDEYRGCGPLGGIHAGLKASGSDYNFVVACDMPYIEGDAIKYMLDAAQGYDAAVPFIDGFFHPLHAVYHRRCLEAVVGVLDRGGRRVVDFYPAVSLRLIDASELARFAPDCRMFCNLNHPKDFLKS